jgi:hypothetical protein
MNSGAGVFSASQIKCVTHKGYAKERKVINVHFSFNGPWIPIIPQS